MIWYHTSIQLPHHMMTVTASAMTDGISMPNTDPATVLKR